MPLPNLGHRTILIGAILAVLAVGAVAASSGVRNALWSALTRLRGRASVDDRIAMLAPEVRQDLVSWCEQQGLAYPPRKVALVALKRERLLQVYGRGDGEWRQLATLPIIGASGASGPKLQEGDGQVPEGVYPLESLNPNSRFHLALRVGYPNDFDRRMASADGRSQLGGDIMIHGGSASIGCLAMGDPVIERLFLLCAEVGLNSVRVVLAPCDLRVSEPEVQPDLPAWVTELHSQLRRELAEFP